MDQRLVKELFDYRDGFLYSKVKRYRKNIGDRVAYLNKDKYGDRYIVCINYKRYLQSRLIFLWHKGYLPKIVDHRNHDTLNDKIDNLRDATPSQNSGNSTSHKNSTSKYLGVSLANRKYKNMVYVYWHARIMINGKQKHLGIFKTEENAAKAYNKAAIRYFGEFANINNIAA